MQSALHEELSDLPSSSQNQQDMWRFANKLLNDAYRLYLLVKKSGVGILKEKGMQTRINLKIDTYINCFQDKELGRKMTGVFLRHFNNFVMQMKMLSDQKHDIITVRRMFTVYFRNLMNSLHNNYNKHTNKVARIDKDKLTAEVYHSISGLKSAISQLISHGLDFESAKILWNLHGQVEEIERKKQTNTDRAEDDQDLAKIRKSVHEILSENI
jgi:hypothetical protein